MNTRTVTTLIALALSLTACARSFGTNAIEDTGLRQAAGGLTVTPNPATVPATQSLQLNVSGGVPPYEFQTLAGPCVVARYSGLVIGQVAGTCSLQVRDSQNRVHAFNVMVTTGGGVTNPPITYTWQAGNWGACSASCNGGTQSRSVFCLASNGAMVNNSYCASATKPGITQACNTQACTTSNPTGTWVETTASASVGCSAYAFTYTLKSPNQAGVEYTIPASCTAIGAVCRIDSPYAGLDFQAPRYVCQ